MSDATINFKNESGLEFSNISSEEFREYNFGKAGFVKINGPLWLHVSDNGHRIFDRNGLSHYVPNGWYSLSWKARSGAPNFVK